jgi:hypothetical protein
MSQIQSYNALIDRFKAFADGHYLIKHFSHGQIDVSDLDKFPMYPFMHVIPSLVNYAEGQKTFSFDVVLADLPRDKDWKPEYQREVLSDLQRIAEDLFAEIQQNQVLFGSMIQLQNASIEPFMQEYKHVLTGWKLTFQMIVPYYWDACTTPASWNDYVSNLGNGNSTVLTFGMSTNLDESGVVTLDNDEEAPSPNHYYGTDEEGVKGWFVLPSGNTFDCEDLLGCTVFTDLQTEVSAKVNSDEISAVGFSNDYNDLDNLPTIPAPVTSVSIVSHQVKLGSAMTKGTPVYVSSADGTNMIVSPAANTSELTSSKTMGLLMTGGANNAQVQVITEGLLAGLNTTAAIIGDPVWLGSTGTLLYGIANKPVAPLHLVFIGIVTRVNANNGEIFVKVQNGFELDEIHNVATAQSKTTPIDADAVLLYDSADANGLWKKLSWSNIKATLKIYFDSLYQTTLGFTPENVSNKQNSLTTDGTGTKYPTIDAVNSRSNVDYAKRVLSWFSDFQSFTDLWFSTSAATFTIRPASEIPFRTNQIGVGLLQSGASASTALFLTTANNNLKTLYLGQGKWNYETSILIPVLSIAASRYRIVCGFGDNNGSAFNEADGVFFIYDEGGTTNGNSASPNWRCITSASNVRTNSNTIPVVANTWLKLRFEVNADATEVKFFINDSLVATHTTNIPKIQNSQTLMLKQGMAKSAPGTINTTMWIDYIGYENFLTTTR